LPELSVPRGFIPKLRNMARAMGTVIIAGLDYRIADLGAKSVHNEAAVIIPNEWRKRRISSRTTMRVVGKTYAAPAEKAKLSKIGFEFNEDRNIWFFDGDDVGNFAVAICYDFLDLERVAAYRGRIQHLFVLAYNNDITSFNHAAEAMARMIFCNVIVCNCGAFGGSLAFTPHYTPVRRVIYQHSGSNLATAQVVEVPVRTLFEHQRKPPRPGQKEFKSLPPGYRAFD